MWLRAFAVWLLMMGTEVIHGLLRTILLSPVVGDSRARQIAVFTGSLLILAITYLCIGWIRPRRSRPILIGVGLAWVCLTVLFEIELGRIILNLPWTRIASDYDMNRGGLMPLGLVAMALSPLIADRLRQ